MGNGRLTGMNKLRASRSGYFPTVTMANDISDPHNATRNHMATIRRVAGLSIMAGLNFIRLLFLISPFLLTIPQIANARADAAYAAIDESVFAAGPPGEANFAKRPQFGPFIIIEPSLALMNGATDEQTPEQFRAMLRAFPTIRQISIQDCPGTENDDANLEVARMIRRAGINTHVPSDGSVRSGGVELFLAGLKRTYEKGAQFGVHSWMDEEGRQADDVPADDPINTTYISFYQEIGLPPALARAFYEFTNRTDFDSIHFMSEAELAKYGIVN